jgi:hypothetical protein
LIDDVIAAWKPRGAAVAMRVMTCNAHSSGYYTSPKWLFDAGCKSFDYVRGGDDPPAAANASRASSRTTPIHLPRRRLPPGLAHVTTATRGQFLDIGSTASGANGTRPPAPVAVRNDVDLTCAPSQDPARLHVDDPGC